MVVLKNIIPSYQGFANSTYGLTYLRHWVGHSLSRLYTPFNIQDSFNADGSVKAGSVVAQIRDNYTRAREAGQVVVDRFLFNAGTNLLSAVGMQATPEQLAAGFYVTDLRHGPTKQKRWDLIKMHRDALYDYVDVTQWGEGVHNEMNFPGGYPFGGAEVLIESFDVMWEEWGKKTSINIGGSSTYMAPLLAHIGSRPHNDRPQWDHQDDYGRENWARLYRQRYEQLGYRPLCSFRETSGGPNDWDNIGLDPLSLYREFLDKKYTILANMGAFPDYVTVDPTTAEFLSLALQYAQNQVADYFVFLGQDDEPPGDGGGDGGDGGDGGGDGGTTPPDESGQTLTIPPDKRVTSIRINYQTGEVLA